LVCAEIARLSDARARNGTFVLISYDEARRVEPIVDSWTGFAENASMGVHTLICEDGPVLPKEPGTRAEKGGEVLEEQIDKHLRG
jgi:hypothetical protein